MSTHFEEIEKQARSLTPQEKAALARVLIQELDQSMTLKLTKFGLKKRSDDMPLTCEVRLKRFPAMKLCNGPASGLHKWAIASLLPT